MRIKTILSSLCRWTALSVSLCMSVSAFAQTQPSPYAFVENDATWNHEGSGVYTVDDDAEDYANEVWERPVKDKGYTVDSGVRTSNDLYFGYGDLKSAGWDVDSTYLYVMWEVVGDFQHEPGKTSESKLLEGHYYFYAKLPGEPAFALEIPSGKDLGSAIYGTSGKIKLYEADGAIPGGGEFKETGASPAGVGHTNTSTYVTEVAVPLSALGYSEADFGVELEWVRIGVAVSNPSSVSDLWARDHFRDAPGEGQEYDTLLFSLVNPSIDIEKDTNGSDADVAPGPMILAGDPVTWSYVVTNTGNTVLTAVAVSDDMLGAVVCPKTALAAAEAMTCTVVGTSSANQYANIGSVVASSPGNTDDVSDSDPSHYFGVDSAIDIEKDTNGFDSDVAPGQSIDVGAAVTWSYTVTNMGNTALTAVVVNDDVLGPITCPQDTLAVAEAMTCQAAGTAALGQYTNLGTVSGTPPVGPPVTDNDPSNYFGTNPAIEIVKTASPQTYSELGTPITYTFAVTNIGNVTLTDVAVTDPLIGLSAITCTPEANPIVDLAPTETVYCTASYSIVQPDIDSGSVVNTATATGQCTVTDCPVTDTDTETITTVSEPAITITKTADPKTYTSVDDPITYAFAVTNNGNITLHDVAVTDETPLPGLPLIACPGEANPIVDLAPGETVNCEVVYDIVQADVEAPFYVDNTAKAEGYPCEAEDGGGYECLSVEDTDDETINAILINLVKTVTSGPLYDPVTGHYTVVYRVTATNIGTASGTYDVVDDNFTNLAAGINLFGTPVVTYIPGDDSLDNDPPGWPTIATGENIGAGNTESWDITAEFTLTTADLTSAAWACNESDAEAGTGFYNSVLTFAGETNIDDNDDCVDMPDADLDLSKQVLTTQNIGVNRYRVTYLVKMENSGDGPGLYDVDDVTGFGAGITLSGIPVVTYVAIDDLFASPVTAPAWTQIALNETIAGQKDESWKVVAEFDVDPTNGGYEANRECVTGEVGWISGKGFFNSVVLSGGREENLLNNKDCSDPDDPFVNLSKTAAPAVYRGGGLFDVTYTFTADNQSTVAASYDLVDTLMPSPALIPIAIQAATAYMPGTESDQDGVIGTPVIGDFATGATLVTGESLAAGADESWTITIRFQLDPALATVENADCVDDDGENGNTGFNNLIMGSSTETDFTDNEACVDLSGGRVEISVLLNPPFADLFGFQAATPSALGGTIGHMGVVGKDVWPGSYVSTLPRSALQFPEWTWLVQGFTCDDGDSIVDLADLFDLTATFNVDPNETVRCTLVLNLAGEDIPVPVNNPWALLLMTLMMLAAAWYFRPATMRNH